MLVIEVTGLEALEFRSDARVLPTCRALAVSGTEGDLKGVGRCRFSGSTRQWVLAGIFRGKGGTVFVFLGALIISNTVAAVAFAVAVIVFLGPSNGGR